MALVLRTMTEALTLADTLFAPFASDTALTAVERAQVAENRNQITVTLNALRPDNTLPQGQRAGRFAALRDRVNVTFRIEDKFLGVDEAKALRFYGGLDLLWDCAEMLRDGIPTSTIDLGAI